jgi:hypothetical protein
MKQHITVEQLFEVDDYKLAKMMDEKFQNAVRDIHCNPYMTDKEKENLLEILSEQVTIGKMIEILEPNISIYPVLTEEEGKTRVIWWEVRYYVKNDLKEFRKVELYDALWEAVKEVLKEVE